MKRSTIALLPILGLIASCSESPVANEAPTQKELLTTTVASSGHGDNGESAGMYRIPYADGTNVGVNNDVHNHNNAYDMSAGRDAPLVAAASGWIRAIVEHHGNDPNAGDGMDALGNPYVDAALDSLEHACLSNDPGNTVPGGSDNCSDYNNYVWIEHPNGEYTKYSHVGTGTVSDNGWSEGDWINAGELIGLENDPGAASCGGCDPSARAFHLHWEVAFANNPGDDLMWSELGGFIQNGSRVPARICDVADNDILAGQNYTANPCTNNTPPTADAGGPYSVDEGSQVVLDGTGSSDPEGNTLTYLWEPSSELTDPWFLDDHSAAEPTFEANDNMLVNLTLNVYDEVEALTDDDATSVTVDNVAPTVDAGSDDSITSDDDFNFSGSFSDPGIVDNPWGYSIDWGDGSSTSDGNTNSQASPIADSHQYCGAGDYTVALSVTDKDGDTGMDDMTLTVEFFAINIDIKPDGTPNPVNLKSKGVLPVAILGSDDFDATAIDLSTLTLGDGSAPDTPVATKKNGKYHASEENVNGDAFPDLVVKFSVPELVANGDLAGTTTSLVIKGFLDDECTNFLGEDDVKVVP